MISTRGQSLELDASVRLHLILVCFLMVKLVHLDYRPMTRHHYCVFLNLFQDLLSNGLFMMCVGVFLQPGGGVHLPNPKLG
jgi:hypothetical protein